MKRIVIVLFVLLLAAFSWYLFVRPFEYDVNFSAHTLPGDIIQTIRIWDRSLAHAEVVTVDSLSGLQQKLSIDGRVYQYNWKFSMSGDSTTKVQIQITQPGRSLTNKLLIPFFDEPIEEDARQTSQQFYKVLQVHLKKTRVRIAGETESPESFCACRRLRTPQTGKANGMMRDYTLLTSFVEQMGLEPDGPPMIRVVNWNHSKGTLEFDFCFPIVNTGSMPPSDSVQYKHLVSEKAVRAIYNGNYITSDRAWYALIHYANSKGYEIKGFPIEVFHNNPNLGLLEEKWKAEVFLPIN